MPERKVAHYVEEERSAYFGRILELPVVFAYLTLFQ
jgi:hypothetical protein